MAKNVFDPREVVNLSERVIIEPPKLLSEKVEELEQEPEEYIGPTADDLRREAEAVQGPSGKKRKKDDRRGQGKGRRNRQGGGTEGLRRNGAEDQRGSKDQTGSRRLCRKNHHRADQRAETALFGSRGTGKPLSKQEARDKGHREGREEGYQEGKTEVDRLVEHLHKIINSAIEKRSEIIDESETQLINLVLQISQKVIKVISENQKNVVVNNVIQALRKLKTRNDVVIRVNLEDVNFASDHVKDFMRMVENVKSITVVEDSSVDKGGCVIETDFGEIDARISSQLNEIQQRILEMTPITVKQE